ncbi:MAG: hypothetical protein JXR96_17510 [Deltaproteobacteria bacterium]|nr:hypothetical protein [Deltaproteobacteria bacterium]
MRKTAWISGLLLMLVGAGWGMGCSGGTAASSGGAAKPKVHGDRTRIAHSEGVEPLWIQECPARTDHLLPFCGEAHKMPSQKSACTAAYTDALGKLSRYIGQKVEASLEPDGQGGYAFQIKGEGDPITIRGAWESERWAEEYEGGGRTHDCYVMITYPVLEYDRLVHKYREVAAQKVAKAKDLHEQGRKLAAEGRHAEAAGLFGRAKKLLEAVKEPVKTDDGAQSDLLLEQVVADLKTSSVGAQEAARTALVVVGLKVDGEDKYGSQDQKLVQNSVQKWLAAKGIKIRPGGLSSEQLQAVLGGDRQAAAQAAASKGAGLLLVVDLESKFSSKDAQAYYSYLSGELRFIRTSDGREIYTSEIASEKGAHPFKKSGAHTKAIKQALDRKIKPAVHAAIGKIP